MYFYNGNLYYIADIWRPSTGDDYTLDLITYKLSSISLQNICELHAELNINYIDGSKVADLISIDTIECERRKGHGSKILKRFIYLSEANNVNILLNRKLQKSKEKIFIFG